MTIRGGLFDAIASLDRHAPSAWHATRRHLRLAGYLTWVAVAWGPFLDALRPLASLPAPRIIGLAALLADLLLFGGVELLGDQRKHRARKRILLALQGIAALIATWGLLPSGSVPVLTILVAAQLPTLFTLRRAFFLLMVCDVLLTCVVLERYGFGSAWPVLLSYVTFQLFALITVASALRAADAQGEMGRINAELLATRYLLTESARVEERLRLSRDLHDVAGHKLTALKLQLRVLSSETSIAQDSRLDDCLQITDQLLDDVRSVVSTLRSDGGFDLATALTALVPRSQRPIVKVTLGPDLPPLRIGVAEALLRCAQEAMTNVLRHADASRVTIDLVLEGPILVLEVVDDGDGCAVPIFGNGLRGMTERLRLLGGALSIAANPGGGLLLRASVPTCAA